jgi:hypothetical protein
VANEKQSFHATSRVVESPRVEFPAWGLIRLVA